MTATVEEWDANPGQDPKLFMRYMSDGTWRSGTAGRTGGGYYPEASDVLTPQQAREWFREQWGYVPGDAVDHLAASETTGDPS